MLDCVRARVWTALLRCEKGGTVRKFLNDPRRLVAEALEGAAELNPHLALMPAHGVLLRQGARAAGRVAVISGGGAGHEPAHAGYVGPGLLDAAVSGDVFTSPSVDAVLAAIRAVGGPAGVLLVVKNYTGDRLNFGLAAEIAAAEGIPCDTVVVADDVALPELRAAGRARGLAGTVLVHKVAGAAAAAGLPLAEVAAEARAAAAALRTMGVGLGPCTVPAAGRPGFDLPAGEMELGLGIHGEAGVARAPLAPAADIAAALLSRVLEDQRPGEVALLVNGLGGTPPLELALLAREALAILRGRGFHVSCAWCGNLMTALEMPGASLTVLPLDAARLARLDAPAEAPGWTPALRPGARRGLSPAPEPKPPEGTPDPALRAALLRVCDAIEAAEAELTRLDAAAGDGDLGASLARGAAALRALPPGALRDRATLLDQAAGALRRAIGGSSGPFIATGLLRAARAAPADALAAAAEAIAALGGAQPGDRTMLDALLPAADAFRAGGLEAAARAARAGAEATASMAPRAGRATYLGERAVGLPDGGAVAVALVLEALARQP